MVESWADECSLSQMIKSSTRHRAVRLSDGSCREEKSCIDLIFVNDPLRVNCSQIPSIDSDHDIIRCDISGNFKKQVSKRKLILRDWRNYTAESALAEALECNLNLEDGESIEQWSSIIELSLQHITNVVAPMRVIKLNHTNDMVNSRVSALKKKRDRKIKKYRRTFSLCMFSRIETFVAM